MPTRATATKIVKRLQDAGYIAYFAGGWVRDLLMQHPSDDIDIATNAPVEKIQELFPQTVPVGIAFGIVIVVEDGHPFEVATFRKDRHYIDGRRPEGYDFATPREDALRRDFTINGMFYDPITDQLYDYVDGRSDIEKKVIRAIGDPHARFGEDRLRMMRAVRYATRFNFTIDPATRKAIGAHADDLLPAVAMERVWQEFKKMALFSRFDQGLIELHQLGLLPRIFPRLREVSKDEIVKRVAPIQHFPKGTPAIAELLELFPALSLDETLEICDYLKISREDKLFVEELHASFALFHLPKEWVEKLEPVEWARFYAKKQAALCLEIFAARLSPDEKKAWLSVHKSRTDVLGQHIERIRTRRPLVQAEDLLKAGIPPGPKLGQFLAEAERISINENLFDKNAVLQRLRID